MRRKEIVDLAQINAILEHAFTSLHCFATKDTKESEDEALGPVLKLRDIEVHQESGLRSRFRLFVSFVLFVVNSLRPPVLLHNRHPSRANRN